MESRVPLIDAHCHASPLWFEPVEPLVFQMDQNGVAKGVLTQVLGQFDNRYQEECLARFPGRFASVGAVNADHAPAGDPSGVRRARLQDAPACRALYAPYVESGVTSFEEEAPSVAEMEGRIADSLEGHEWLVLEEEGRVVGFAYGNAHRARPAYRWSCEVSVYLEPGRRRTGAGRMLYEALFPRLVERGFLTALAGMTLPNPASEGLHRSLGFVDVGTWRRIGWKFGAWHDVRWLQRVLEASEEAPTELT